MFKNYFKTALRNLWRNKVFSLINISSLSIGLACAMLIILYVKDEVSYDRFNVKADRIVRVAGKITTETESFDHAVTSVPMASALKQDFPEVENTVRIDKNDAIVVRNGTK